MQTLQLKRQQGKDLKILCLGAHSDDLEIGCYATLRHLITTSQQAEVFWVVLCAGGVRGKEASSSARQLLRGVKKSTVVLKKFRDGFLPYSGWDVKDFFEEIKPRFEPDVILTHARDDRHQDHRLVSDLTWNTYRDHFILEYEIPKYDGDLGSPNLFVPFGEPMLKEKIEHVMKFFPSQQGKKWFSPETFAALSRLRGMECSAPEDHAEGFYSRKIVFEV
jgi:LmbE family N-acetylglucosaminyl deacetylase